MYYTILTLFIYYQQRFPEPEASIFFTATVAGAFSGIFIREGS